MDRTKIKVVKRSDIALKPVKAAKRRVISSKNSARQVVANVSEWVNDLKVRKTEETKAAIDMLFSNKQRPNES